MKEKGTKVGIWHQFQKFPWKKKPMRKSKSGAKFLHLCYFPLTLKIPKKHIKNHAVTPFTVWHATFYLACHTINPPFLDMSIRCTRGGYNFVEYVVKNDRVRGQAPSADLGLE